MVFGGVTSGASKLGLANKLVRLSLFAAKFCVDKQDAIANREIKIKRQVGVIKKLQGFFGETVNWIIPILETAF